MSLLDLAPGYTDGSVLLEADLDAIQLALTTFFNTTGISDDSIQTGGITGSTKLVNNSVTAATIQTGTVLSTKIAPAAITTAKILDATIENASIADLAVSSTKVGSNTLLNANFAAGSVTVAKLATCNFVLATTAISYTTSTTSEESVTNATLSITTTGKPVWVGLQATAAGAGYVAVTSNTGAVNQRLRIYRGASLVLEQELALRTNSASLTIKHPPGEFWTIDSPAAGTYTYTVALHSATSGDLAILGSPKLYAFEVT